MGCHFSFSLPFYNNSHQLLHTVGPGAMLGIVSVSLLILTMTPSKIDTLIIPSGWSLRVVKSRMGSDLYLGPSDSAFVLKCAPHWRSL